MSSEEKTSEDNGEPPSRFRAFKRKRHRSGPQPKPMPSAMDLLQWFAGVLLFFFFFGPQSDALDSSYAIGSAALAFLVPSSMFITVLMARRRDDGSLYRLTVWVVACFLLIFVSFSNLYWAIGTTANFNAKLSHVDAIYFTLGTLTTAGTGTIAPTSDLSRALVSGQMVLDLVFVAVVVTTAVTRWSEKSS